MQEGRRSARVGKLIQEELSGMLVKGLKDPRLKMVSITGVDVTEDLSFARVFFCVFDSEHRKEEVLNGLNSAAGFIRRELGHRLDLRRIPDMAFEFDTSFDYGDRIEKLLKEALPDVAASDPDVTGGPDGGEKNIA